MQDLFIYAPQVLRHLGVTLSSERLSTYETLSGGDRETAVRLYTWNTALSEALYGPLQALEVATRNVLHHRLAAGFGADWYDNPSLRWEHEQNSMIKEAKESLHRKGHPVTPPDMVAKLSFGFWTGILGSSYENNLWRPHFRSAFPNAPEKLTRKVVLADMNRLRLLRNRIAHHEPILNRHLLEDHVTALRLIEWMCRDSARWAASHSRFLDVWNSPINPRLAPYCLIGARRISRSGGEPYEVVGLAPSKVPGHMLMRIRLLSSGEEADYPYLHVLGDPS